MHRLVPLLLLAAWPAHAAPPAITPASVPATGDHAATLVVPQAGRYAVVAKSPHGVRLRLVDPMTGPGPQAGRPGAEDGRLDLLLDAGTYRVLVNGPRTGDGDAALTVVPTVEEGPDDLRLDRGATAEGTLGEHRARGWWIHVPDRQLVAVDAIGAHLADLRLWKDGQWLVDAEPACTVVATAPGEPRRLCGLTTLAEPGLYRVVAYGGPALAWSQQDAPGRDTVFVRSGPPALAAGGVRGFSVGPFGVERFRAPAGLAYATVELDRVVPARLGARAFDVRSALGPPTVSQALAVDARRPTLAISPRLADAIITVTAPPGTRATLRWLPPETGPARLGPGTFFATVVHTAGPDDPPPSAIWIRTGPDGQPALGSAGVVPLGPAGIDARFNLAGTTEVFAEVTEAGPFRLELEGGRLRVEPWWLTPPPHHVPPPLVPLVEQTLGAGLYRVTLVPDVVGAVRWTVTGASPGAPAAPSLRWDILQVADKTSLSLFTAANPGVRSALIARPLPADVGDGLPLRLGPGERLSLPVRAAEGVFVATRADGTRLPLSAAGSPFAPSAAAQAGFLVIHNDADAAADVELRVVPEEAAPGQVPRLTAAHRAALPAFPLLAARAPQALDLERGQRSTWRVRVDEPGLYTVESTGLLATRGALRTRVRPSIGGGGGGGSGRNFSVSGYLQAGEYQLTVEATGASAGHLGLKLAPVELVDGGALEPDRTARLRLPARTAARYQVDVATAGRYRVTSLGPGATLDCRVEDDAGFPLAPAEGRCDRTVDLTAGRWHLILLPRTMETVRLTRVERLLTATPTAGHGPHPLPFDEAAEHVWEEPAEGAPRDPDVWTFTLPADAGVTLRMSPEVVGDLYGADGQRVTRVAPDTAYEGPLPRGAYRLEVRGAYADDGALYTVRLDADVLLAGNARFIQPYDETSVPFAVGEAGLYTLVTEGRDDVHLKVLDADDQVVGRADDQAEDWNPRLTLRLAPGRYRAVVEGVEQTPTRLRLLHAVPVDAPALAVGKATSLVPTAGGVAMRLEGAGAIVRAEVQAEESVALAVEAEGPAGWRILAEAEGRRPVVLARPDPKTSLRLRVTSLEERGRLALVRASSLTPTAVEAGRLAAGAAPGTNAEVAVFPQVSPGVLAMSDVPRGALLCPTVGAGCRPAEVGPVAVGATPPVFVVGPGALRGRRLTLTPESARLPTGAEALVVDGAQGVGPRWIEVKDPIGQPGVALPGGATAYAPRRAAAVELAGALSAEAAQARVWSADGSVLTPRARTALLTLLPEEAVATRWAGDLPPGSARVLRLPGARAVRATLGAGAALLTLEPGRLAWAAEAALVEDVDQAGLVVVLNPTAGPVPVALQLEPARAVAPVAEGAPAERRPIRAGTLRLPVAAVPGARLRVVGAAGAFIAADGRVGPADGADPAAGGEVRLDHGRAPVAVWLESPGQAGPFPEGEVLPAEPVDGPTTIALDGPRRLTIRLPGPALVTARAAPGVVLHGAADGGPLRTGLDGELDLWLPTGVGEITARALAGEPPRGPLAIGVEDPVEAGEGLGPVTLLAPGDTRVYHLTTTRKGAIGIGIRADVDRVEARLLDAAGAEIAAGASLMPTLEAGRYLLALHLPADAPATRARPAVVGLAAPPDTPPPEVAAEYQPVAVRAAAPKPPPAWRSPQAPADYEDVPADGAEPAEEPDEQPDEQPTEDVSDDAPADEPADEADDTPDDTPDDLPDDLTDDEARESLEERTRGAAPNTTRRAH